MKYKIIIPKEEPKQESVVNGKCFKCDNSEYKMRRPFCTDEFCNKDFYENPKQETLEEVAERLYPVNNTGSMFMASRDELNNSLKKEGFIAGAKYQQEKSYSEEEVLEMLNNFNKHTLRLQELKLGNSFNVDDWFKKFKKK